MAVRVPLYYDAGNLREMSPTQVNEIIAQVSYQYSLNPSVTLSVVTSGGTLSGLPISDTRKQAGAYRTFVNRFPTEGETDEPGTVTVNYARLNESVASLTEPTDTNSRLYPLFNNAGNIQSMSSTDMYDTFILPAIDNLTSGSTGTAQGGTYRIHTSTSLANHTLISSTAVFKDTRANTSKYTAGGIPEALDQSQTISNFYLFRINGASSSYTAPVYIRSDAQIQTYDTGTFNGLLQSLVRYAAASKSGTRIRYNINGSGNNRGSGMTNTILNGSGNYQTRFANADDYRAQEFPNGSPVTANTYYLRINQS
jgi:hypothetical protein